MSLPSFRYYPDPLASGSIEKSTTACVCCKKQRGYIYCGPVYSKNELQNVICPWCIASNEAHLKFGAEFTDSAGVGDPRVPNTLGQAIIDEVAYRTPGFTGWQQERWLSCCNDAAQFLGRAGQRELQTKWPEAIESVKADCGLEGSEWENFFCHLDADESPTAYVFRCLHCKRYSAYQDCD